ncbi:ABC transporter permease [Candidatus Berkelbacteria bacterium]|nr:ABC transporter permease [Candidatus Berkelbacteria bacterium]MBI2588250.1 ABC transporter permease [Candidatus Berkelbacteria bacterium]MBI4029982.1 ABC transporter permease [Candidatus Berkelbacteria bacterium]
MWVNIKRIFKLGLVNFWRNRWLSLMAIIMMTITLFTISVFLILNSVVETTVGKVKEKIDLTINFKEEATDEQINELKSLLELRSDVKQIEYISKQRALEIWQQSKVKERIKSLVTPEDNPLPRSLQIKATDPTQLEEIAAFLGAEKYSHLISTISYQQNQAVIKRLLNILTFSRQFGLLISLTFMALSVFVIINTIRLAIFTRREEIEIMKLVGATDTFTRAPFVVEGMFYGLFAAIFAFLTILGLVRLVTPQAVRYLGDIGFSARSFLGAHLFETFLIQLLLGLVLGAAASYFSVKKYLKV